MLPTAVAGVRAGVLTAGVLIAGVLTAGILTAGVLTAGVLGVIRVTLADGPGVLGDGGGKSSGARTKKNNY